MVQALCHNRNKPELNSVLKLRANKIRNSVVICHRVQKLLAFQSRFKVVDIEIRTYKIIILLVVSRECENWSLTLKRIINLMI